MARHRKYTYEFIVQGYYSYGWEDVNSEDNRKDGNRSLKEYRSNDPYHSYRLIMRRVPVVTEGQTQ